MYRDTNTRIQEYKNTTRRKHKTTEKSMSFIQGLSGHKSSQGTYDKAKGFGNGNIWYCLPKDCTIYNKSHRTVGFPESGWQQQLSPENLPMQPEA